MKLYARVEADGLVHYGDLVNPAAGVGLVYLLEIAGGGEAPASGSTATVAQHEAWLAEFRRRGLAVRVDRVDEPALWRARQGGRI
jgi:hypothetical protein